MRQIAAKAAPTKRLKGRYETTIVVSDGDSDGTCNLQVSLRDCLIGGRTVAQLALDNADANALREIIRALGVIHASLIL